MELTPQQHTRYSRHLILPQIGFEGQKALRSARIVIVGAGGLGCPAAIYLAAAGIGAIGLIDFDSVETTNLQRQILYSDSDIGRPKVQAAEDRLHDVNPDTVIEKHDKRLTAANALKILESYDVIVDGTDNFPTRYLLNDACVMLKKPYVYGSIYRFDGQASVFGAQSGPCYRCLYPEPPDPDEVPSCAEGGVLGVLPAVIGSIQATEAIKIVLDKGRSLIGRLLLYNALDMRFRELAIKRDPDCPMCGQAPTIAELIDYDEFCGVYEEEQPTQGIPQIDVDELKQKFDRKEDFCLLDVRLSGEFAFCAIPDSINVPMPELRTRLEELNPHRARQIAVVCREGLRSQKACEILTQAGFADIVNVVGGILAWSHKIDQTMPSY